MEWKKVYITNAEGRFIEMELCLPKGSSLLLLNQIQSMPKKEGIMLFYAFWLAIEHLKTNPAADLWMQDNWVQWISSQDYHIELTGDEFIF